MAKVVTSNGMEEEGTLTWHLWREDAGASWTVVHELRDLYGKVVRRDSWVIFKAETLPALGAKTGEM